MADTLVHPEGELTRILSGQCAGCYFVVLGITVSRRLCFREASVLRLAFLVKVMHACQLEVSLDVICYRGNMSMYRRNTTMCRCVEPVTLRQIRRVIS